MNKPATAAALVDMVRLARAELDELLARIPDARADLPGVVGTWSVKDLVAHITWHEREMVRVLQARALAGSPLWGLPTDERNATIYIDNRDRTLADVQQEAAVVWQQLLAALATLVEADLIDASRFADMPPEWEPWQLLAENTYAHYQDHVPHLQAWLAAGGGEDHA